MTHGTGDPWFALALLGLGGAGAAVKKIREWRTPTPGTVDHVKSLYATGEIDERELERRLDVLADPEATRIRQAVERVSGIGEKTSWDVAARYRSLDDVREAPVEDLTEVPNIGEKRAKALKENL